MSPHRGPSAWLEAMSMLAALSTGKALLLGVASGIVLVIAVLAGSSTLRRPRRPAELDIPPGMKPGPSDPDLEKPLLEKLQFWGTLLVVAMALGTGAVFWTEPKTNANDTRAMVAQSILRGHL